MFMTTRKKKDLLMEIYSEVVFESELSDVYDCTKEEEFAHGKIL